MAVIDDGPSIHYTAVPRGTPVYASDGTQVGTVDQVVDNYREHILDGIVIRTESSDLRFVDAPEVSRTAERGVTLTIGPDQVDAYCQDLLPGAAKPEKEKNPPSDDQGQEQGQGQGGPPSSTGGGTERTVSSPGPSSPAR